MQDTIQVFLFNRVWVNQQKSANTAKVGKTPEGFKLYQHKRGHQPILIGPNQVVNLREPGVERFTTMPKDTTEGRAGTCLRQGFRLPESDEAYLHGLGLTWEALLEGASRWLIIHEWTIPAGYNQGQVSLALLIPATIRTARSTWCTSSSILRERTADRSELGLGRPSGVRN